MNEDIIILRSNISQIYSFDLLMQTELMYSVYEIEVCYHSLLKHYDSNDLHDMRVNLRRLLSFLHFFKKEIPKKEWNTITKTIKKLIKPTSRVRDYDVFNKNYIVPVHRLNNKKDYTYLLSSSDEELNKLHKNLIRTLQSKEYRNYLKQLRKWIVGKKWKSKNNDKDIYVDKELRSLIEKRLNKKFNKLKRSRRRLYEFDQKMLHKIRMNAKELRYVMGIFRYSIKHKNSKLIYLKDLQDILGYINDSYVAEEILAEYSKDNRLSKSTDYIQFQTQATRKNKFTQLSNMLK